VSVGFVLFALAGAFFAWADEEPSAWTNVAGNVIVGEVVAVDATSVTFVTCGIGACDAPSRQVTVWAEPKKADEEDPPPPAFFVIPVTY